MPDINSPLGRRAFAMANQRMLTVPNEETPIPSSFASPPQEIPQQVVERDIESIQTARKVRVMAAKKITVAAKERIELLTGLGRCTDTVEFEGVTFSIRSLKGPEIRNVVRMANKGADAADSFFIARDQTLVYSIYEIDGEPISLVLGSDDIADRIAFIEEMEEPLLEYLHNAYLQMIRNNKHRFVIKNEEDAKEVAEDIKK